MVYSREDILRIMRDERYPLSSRYDPDWILTNAMGAHTLWLQEALAQVMDLRTGERVLDMGCGRAISSIFLAREFGVQVWATDLWNGPTENYERIRKMHAEDRVFPIGADAGALPFADGFFDAMVSVNSLFYYATPEGFLREHVLRHVRPGGEIGVIVPGFHTEYDGELPEAYRPYAEPFHLAKYHTARWWAKHFEQSRLVDVILADMVAGHGTELYQNSARIFNAHEEPFNMLAWEDITFVRILAKRKG